MRSDPNREMEERLDACSAAYDRGYDEASRDEQWRSRAQLTRALVAQQWAVACRVFDPMWRPDSIDPSNGDGEWALVMEHWWALAALPCAADLAAEILGGEP